MRQSSPDYVGALSLIALGAVLGPSGLGVLTSQLLELVDPAIPVGLAALGVLASFEFRTPTRTDPRGAMVVALGLVVAAAVAGGVTLLAFELGIGGAPLRVLAAVTCVCALAASSRNDTVPILLGAVVLAWTTGQPTMAAWTMSTATAVAVGCAAIGWLLLRPPSTAFQQRGVTIALLLLIGGAADYVLASALLGGLAAGVCWRLLGGPVQESVRRDVAYFRHAALAILLLTAGAYIEISSTSIAVGVAYGVGGAVFSRLGERVTSIAVTGSSVLAVAFAMSALRIAGPEMALPFAAVVIGTLLSQLLGMSRGHAEVFE